MSSHGIKFGTPEIDIDSLRSWKDSIVGKLVGGLTGMSKQRKVRVVEGYGEFLDPFHIRVATEDGGSKTIKFEKPSSQPDRCQSPYHSYQMIQELLIPLERLNCAADQKRC